MKLTLKIWRQKNNLDKGKFVTYNVDNIPEEASFLEMLDILNESLVLKGSLSNPDEGIRKFWVEHSKRCREIADAMGKAQNDPCLKRTTRRSRRGLSASES